MILKCEFWKEQPSQIDSMADNQWSNLTLTYVYFDTKNLILECLNATKNTIKMSHKLYVNRVDHVVVTLILIAMLDIYRNSIVPV